MTDKEVDKYKQELADKLAPLISKEGLTDVTDWIIKNAGERNGVGFNHNGVARSVAYILEATGDFQLEQLEDKSRFYVKRLPKRSLEQRQPTLFKLGLFLLGILATSIGVLLNNQSKPQQGTTIIQVQDSRIDSLNGVVTNLQHDMKNVQDTLAKYK